MSLHVVSANTVITALSVPVTKVAGLHIIVAFMIRPVIVEVGGLQFVVEMFTGISIVPVVMSHNDDCKNHSCYYHYLLVHVLFPIYMRYVEKISYMGANLWVDLG